MTGHDRRSLLREAAERLRAAGIESPDHDASELLAHTVGTPRTELLLLDEVTTADVERFEALVTRRAAREPLQHLTGVAYFRHVSLEVGPGVFVPRPETELLAGWAIEQAHDVANAGEKPVILDLCTGSGAIAKAIANEVPWADIHAVELSEDAYHWAARNLIGTGVDLRQGDMATAFGELLGGVDVVVCNPPYIPLDAWESVAAEARDHDPDLALFSGDDGLDAMRILERRAAELLKPGGFVGAEHADAQGDGADGGGAPAVFSATGRWRDVRDHIDLAGRPRFTTARLAR